MQVDVQSQSDRERDIGANGDHVSLRFDAPIGDVGRVRMQQIVQQCVQFPHLNQAVRALDMS